MPVTVSNLLMGPAKLYTGAVGAAEPPSNATALAVAWTDVGGTTDGLTITINQTYTPMVVDQVGIAVGSRKTELGVSVTTNLAEATLANMRLAVNQATSATTFVELDTDISNADPNYTALCIEGQKPGGGPRRIFVRRTLSTESIGTAYSKDGMTILPVTWTAYYVSSSIKPVRWDDTP